MSSLAAVAAGWACLLLLGGTPALRIRRLFRPSRAGRAGRPLVRAIPLAAVVAAAAAGWLLGEGGGAVVGFAVAAPAATAGLLLRRQAARASAANDSAAVAAGCSALAGLIRVGHVPAAALRVAARDSPVLAEVAAVQEAGGDVAACLRRLGTHPGRGGLVELGVAWELAERTGASLGATLDALAERLVGARTLTDVVEAELSAPRATGRLLAVLPVAGLLLGYGLGGDPVAFLTGSVPGRLCLAAGVALACAGVFWTERIAAGPDG